MLFSFSYVVIYTEQACIRQQSVIEINMETHIREAEEKPRPSTSSLLKDTKECKALLLSKGQQPRCIYFSYLYSTNVLLKIFIIYLVPFALDHHALKKL